ncbi:hypothetical protein L210DRAFT_949439, partial [Boletus edulis BED1]
LSRRVDDFETQGKSEGRHWTLEGKCEQAVATAKADGQRKGVMVVSTRKNYVHTFVPFMCEG